MRESVYTGHWDLCTWMALSPLLVRRRRTPMRLVVDPTYLARRWHASCGSDSWPFNLASSIKIHSSLREGWRHREIVLRNRLVGKSVRDRWSILAKHLPVSLLLSAFLALSFYSVAGFHCFTITVCSKFSPWDWKNLAHYSPKPPKIVSKNYILLAWN